MTMIGQRPARTRGGGVVGAAIVIVAVAAASWIFLPGSGEGPDTKTRNKDDGRHRITVQVWSTASKTRISGNVQSNERGTLWRDELTTGRLHDPFRKHVDITDDESVSVTVFATVAHENEDRQMECFIKIDGKDPRVLGGRGDFANSATVEVGEAVMIKCHMNYVGRNLR